MRFHSANNAWYLDVIVMGDTNKQLVCVLEIDWSGRFENPNTKHERNKVSNVTRCFTNDDNLMVIPEW